jgi:hypothetical protein
MFILSKLTKAHCDVFVAKMLMQEKRKRKTSTYVK